METLNSALKSLQPLRHVQCVCFFFWFVCIFAGNNLANEQRIKNSKRSSDLVHEDSKISERFHGACWLTLDKSSTESSQSDGIHFGDRSISSVCSMEGRRGPQAAKAELRLHVSLNTAIRDWAELQSSETGEMLTHCPWSLNIYYTYIIIHIRLASNTWCRAGHLSPCGPATDLQLPSTAPFHYETITLVSTPQYISFLNDFQSILLRFSQCKDRPRVSPALSGEAWQPLRTPLTQLCCKSTAFLIRVFQFACISTSLAGLYYSSGALCLPSRRFHRYLGPARLWQEGYKWAEECDSSCACACVCSHTRTFFFF